MWLVRQAAQMLIEDRADDTEESAGGNKNEGVEADGLQEHLELPVHTFKKGDPVVFQSARTDGTIPDSLACPPRLLP